jgi:hypothetical protein
MTNTLPEQPPSRRWRLVFCLLDAAHAAVRAWSDAKWRVLFAFFVMLAVMQAVESFGPKWGWNEAVIQWVGIEGYLTIVLILLWWVLGVLLWLGVILLWLGFHAVYSMFDVLHLGRPGRLFIKEAIRTLRSRV